MSPIRRAVIVALILSLPCSVSAAYAAQSCEELYRYRDTELFQEWAATLESHRELTDAKTLAKDTALRILDRTRWDRSDAGVFTKQLKHEAMFLASQIGTLLELSPETGEALRTGALLGVKLDPELVKVGLTTGKVAKDAVKGGMLYAFVMEWGKRAFPIGKPLKALWDLGAFLGGQQQIELDREELSLKVYGAVTYLQQEIANYEDQLRQSQVALEQLNAVKQGIETFCSEQVQGAPDSRETKKNIICDLTGRWEAQSGTSSNGQFSPAAMLLRSEGNRVTGRYSGPIGFGSSKISGDVRSDGHPDN